MCTFPTLALPSLDLVCIQHRKQPRFRTLLKNAVGHFCRKIIFTTFKPSRITLLSWKLYIELQTIWKPSIFKKSIGFCQCKILRSFTRLSCFISAGTGFGSHLVKCRILSFTRRLVAAKKKEKRATLNHFLGITRTPHSKPQSSQTIFEQIKVDKQNYPK